MSQDFIVDLPDLGIKLNTFDPNVDPIISNWLHRDKIWEPMMTKLLLEDFKTNKWFLDVGANIGYYTILALMNGMNVTAVEPKLENYEKLVKNVELTRDFNYGVTGSDWEDWRTSRSPGEGQRVILFKKAISNTSKTITLSADKNNSGDIRIASPEDTDRVNLEVETVSLNYIHALHAIDIMKLDIQGYEHKAVLGLMCNPSIIYTEIEPPLLELNGTSVVDYLHWFRDRGYQHYKVIDEVNKKYLDFDFNEALTFLITNKDTYPGHFNVRIS